MERRQHVRVSSWLHATYCVEGTSEFFDSLTMTISVSKGGISLLTKNLIRRGSKLQIEIKPPGGGPAVSCKGEVVWSGALYLSGEKESEQVPRGYESGIRFIEITEEGVQTLMRYALSNPFPDSSLLD